MFGVDTCGFNGNTDEELWYDLCLLPSDAVLLNAHE